jgi:predicted GNAT family acetyltransferase
MSTPSLSHTASDTHGRIVALDEGIEIGELTYRLRDGIMTIDHTEVDPERQGKGIARALVHAAVDVARQRGLRVDATCSYAALVLRRDFSNTTSISGE